MTDKSERKVRINVTLNDDGTISSYTYIPFDKDKIIAFTTYRKMRAIILNVTKYKDL